MLGEAGLVAGDKVAFLMDNGLLTAQLFLGTIYGGYVAVPLNVRAGVLQLGYMLDHSDVAIVFTEKQYRSLLAEALGNIRREIRVIETDVDGVLPAFESVTRDVAPQCPGPEDAALLMYSSGSTGKPKAAIHSHRSLIAHGRNSIAAHELTAADRSLLVLPLYHINAECVTLVPTLLTGGSVVVAHRFVVSRFWDWVEEYKVTWSALVPTIILELVDWDDLSRRPDAAYEHVRFFRSSSAPLSPSLQQRFMDKFPIPLLQAMGSTEGGNVFSNPQPPAANKIGSPGLPWGFETRIVDREGADVAPGEPGEVLLRGPALMRGYYKDPEGTAAAVDSEGWLHTGDLARRDEEGYFFVVGRSKELIIKGGVNIAPRQIDEVMESHPAVAEAAAVGVPDRYFGEDAIAFAVLRAGATADEKQLQAFCESRLGHFKTPSRIHFLKELPKGPSGKVQRLRLLDPAILAAVAFKDQSESRTVTINGGPRAGDGLLAASSIEQIIAEVWSEALGVAGVDSHTNFFALGGHSLLAIQCLSKLRDRLPIVLLLADFFEFGTIAEQTRVVRERLAASHGAAPASGESVDWEQTLLQHAVAPVGEKVVPRQDPSATYPLTPAQQALWFLEKLNPEVPVYNEVEAVRLTGQLNVEMLESAMNMVIDRHDVLRSTIKVADEVPHAVIHRSWPVRFKRIDLSTRPTGEQEAEVERLLREEPQVRYRLEEEPGIRITLLRQALREHILILMMHHIVCDWASEGIIWRDLSAIYRSLLTGQDLNLPEAEVNHGDYAVWRSRPVSSDTSSADLAYWEETLKGAQALLELPADRPRPPVISHRGNRIRRRVNRALTEALRQISPIEKASLFTIFAAALDVLLFRYSGREDILVGVPIADRDYAELQKVVGYLLRIHVLRTQISGEMTFRDLLGRVQKAALDLYQHRGVPFDQVVTRLRPERNLSYTPVFQVMLNWRDRDQMLPFIGLEGLTIDSLVASAATSKFDLFLFATDLGEEIWLELEYNTDIFDGDRMVRMLDHFQTLLEGVAADPGARLCDLPLTTAAENERLLLEWNKSDTKFPAERSVQELFEEQAARTPDADAVGFEDCSLTYAQLNRRANQLAHHLAELGIGPETLVGVCLERSLDMVVAALGILKAGGAYVPLDPAFPQVRLSQMVEDSGMRLLVTHRDLAQQLQTVPEQLVRLDRDSRQIANRSQESSGLQHAEPHHRAYVLYTSGSTGKPKGVEIPHSALTNFLLSMQREPGFSADDTLLAVTTL
jgi:acyl-CoA synthetase (AMP-forming)/AMP-acid ligase II